MIRPLRESDIPETQRIVRLAFGTFLGVPDAENFASDMDYVQTRWRADATAAFVADVDGQLVGSNFATHWGSVAFFGPLTVRPDFWNKGIAQQLMQPVMECFDRWQVTHAGLFTFAESPKHISLYQKYGFYPRFLTAIMSKSVSPKHSKNQHWGKLTDVAPSDHDSVIRDCNRLTGAVYPGLNVEREVRSVHAQSLGDTVLLWEEQKLVSFAVCHCGPGTEAGNGKCYIKFGVAHNELHFEKLLASCEELAASRGMTQLEAGVNLSREEAYRRMRDHGFRIERTGVAMHRAADSGYSKGGVYVIDDWR
jgi:GNAT superfamily N-acetyltransferase